MKTIFIDVDSQRDFLYPTGALYAPGAERVTPAIAHLNHYAARHAIPVISTTDAHSENDPEFAHWPHHCIVGTTGQRKAETTLLDRRTVVPNRPCELHLEGAQQIVVEKQHVDAFTAPNFERVIEALGGERFVVYGVVTEVCVLWAVRGLLRLGKQVTVVRDAIAPLSPEGSAAAIEEMLAGGATLCQAAEL